MRFAESEVQHMLARDQTAHAEREATIARHVRDATDGRPLRRRVGEAVIRVGIHLAGDHAGLREQRRLVPRTF